MVMVLVMVLVMVQEEKLASVACPKRRTTGKELGNFRTCEVRFKISILGKEVGRMKSYLS
jgi:hypothetical protein